MRILAVVFAAALSTACMSTSAAESMAVWQDLVVKGQKVGKDVDDLMKRERPQAALVMLNRHMREVDELIGKVEEDPKIDLSHEAELLKQMRGYRGDLKASAAQLKLLSDVQSRMGSR
jgi:hypothetical protein